MRFKERALLRQAVVHRSFLNEQPDVEMESYERLEYLGDAFLGWVAADELYKRYPHFDEGHLTRSRAALVRGTTLAEIAREIGVGSYLYMGQGEDETGGRERRSVLAAVAEAIVGAVLLDRGEKAAKALVLRWISPRMDALGTSGAPRDAKRALQELCQQRGLPLPVYELLTEEGPSHAKHFVVRVIVDGDPLAQGEGGRKADAEQMAAELAHDAMAG